MIKREVAGPGKYCKTVSAQKCRFYVVSKVLANESLSEAHATLEKILRTEN